MSVYAGPNTTSSGLVLHIDPSNPRCYPGSGSTLFDLSGGGNNGTLTNGASVVSQRSGFVLDFDGINDYISVLPIIPALGFSFTCWMRSANPSRTRQSIFANSTDASPDIYIHVESLGGGASQAMNFYNGGGYLGASSTFIMDTNWHHYAWVTTMSGQVLYYRDGILIGAAASAWTPLNDNSSVATLGGIVGLLGSGFNLFGQLDDCRRYNRTLLFLEIINNFNATRGRYGI